MKWENVTVYDISRTKYCHFHRQVQLALCGSGSCCDAYHDYTTIFRRRYRNPEVGLGRRES